MSCTSYAMFHKDLVYFSTNALRMCFLTLDASGDDFQWSWQITRYLWSSITRAYMLQMEESKSGLAKY